MTELFVKSVRWVDENDHHSYQIYGQVTLDSLLEKIRSREGALLAISPTQAVFIGTDITDNLIDIDLYEPKTDAPTR